LAKEFGDFADRAALPKLRLISRTVAEKRVRRAVLPIWKAQRERTKAPKEKSGDQKLFLFLVSSL
jgi:hypothetical protein